MKKAVFSSILIAISILAGVFLGYTFFSDRPNFRPQPSGIQLIEVASPETLEIPKLGIKAKVESVGLDPTRKMDVPKTPEGVGWYNLGPKPGEVGNAVIDGHLDSETGPAVFYGLSSLQPGDQIKVIDSSKQSFTFTVTGNITYQFDQVPLDQIFGSANTVNLNLITCGGFFNHTTRNYSSRVVIYSTLKQ
jgi:sortase A